MGSSRIEYGLLPNVKARRSLARAQHQVHQCARWNFTLYQVVVD